MTKPNPGTLTISLDFELHWGVRDTRSVADCRARFEGTHSVVPELLSAFAKRRIHATWATVGMLFFETKQDLLGSLPARRPHYRRTELSPYRDLDSLGNDYREDPYHFAPRLIGMIAGSPNQELATHTFSHYYCLESGTDAGDFRSDLEAAIAAARRYGVVLKSIVFPRNRYSAAHLAVSEELGLRAYRGNPDAWLWRPSPAKEDGLLKRGGRLLDAHLPVAGHNCWVAARTGAGALVNVKASRSLRPVGGSITGLDRLRLRRIRMDMLHAARRGAVYHLWWHPENFGEHPAQNLEFLGSILDWFDRLRGAEGMRSLNMGELSEIARQ